MNLLESRAWAPEHPGWSTDILPFLDFIADRVPADGLYVEVGVFLGRSLRFMGSRRPDLRLVAVDPWADGESQGYTGPGEHRDFVEAHGGLYNAYRELMWRYCPSVAERVVDIRGTSADYIGPIADLVFIDGAHDYESVKADIAHMRKWVRPGGIIAGHDYNPEWQAERDGPDDGRAGVIMATREAFGDAVRIGYCEEWSTCWWVET